MNHLIDSNVVIDFMADRRGARAVLVPLITNGMAISIISFGEIWEGIIRSRYPRRTELEFSRFLGWAIVIGLDEPTMKRFAAIRAHLRPLGLLIPDADTLIAATALHHDLTLVTRNTRHFE